MKALNMKSMGGARQSGFTIIELIVVILLLGILTATALPRFLDVTDDAHDAVVDAVRGGLNTGVALFRAQWTAGGEETGAITQFNSLFPNTTGFPVGTADATLDTNADCSEIFIGLLQEGRPSIFTSAQAVNAAIDQTDVTAADGFDFVAKLTDNTGPNICSYAYIAQFQSVADDDIPVLVYNSSTGAVTVGTAL